MHGEAPPVAEAVLRRPAPDLRDRLLSGSLWILISQVVIQAMSVAVTVVLARYLGRTETESAELLGTYLLYSTIFTVLATVATLGIFVGLPRIIAELQATRSPRLAAATSNGLTLGLIASALVGIGAFLGADLVSLAYPRHPELILLLRVSTPAVVFSVLSVTALSVLQGLQRIREYSLVAMAFSVLSVPVTWLLVIQHRVFLLENALTGAAVAATVNIVLNALGVVWVVRRQTRLEGLPLRLRVDRAESRALLSLSMPALGSALVLRPALLYQTSIIFLVLKEATTGVWKITSAFYRVILFVPAALAIPLLPAMSQLYVTAPTRERREKVTKVLRITFVLVLPLCLIAGLGAQYLIGFLFGPTYVNNDSVYATFLLTAAAFFDAGTVVVISLLQGTGRTRQAFALDGLQAAIIVVLTFLLIRDELKLRGAAAATLGNSVVILAVSLGYLARRQEVDLRSIGDMIGLGVAAFGVAGIVILLGLATWAFIPLAAATVAVTFLVGWRLLWRSDREILRHAFRLVLPRGKGAPTPSAETFPRGGSGGT